MEVRLAYRPPRSARAQTSHRYLTGAVVVVVVVTGGTAGSGETVVVRCVVVVAVGCTTRSDRKEQADTAVANKTRSTTLHILPLLMLIRFDNEAVLARVPLLATAHHDQSAGGTSRLDVRVQRRTVPVARQFDKPSLPNLV